MPENTFLAKTQNVLYLTVLLIIYFPLSILAHGIELIYSGISRCVIWLAGEMAFLLTEAAPFGSKDDLQ